VVLLYGLVQVGRVDTYSEFSIGLSSGQCVADRGGWIVYFGYNLVSHMDSSPSSKHVSKESRLMLSVLTT